MPALSRIASAVPFACDSATAASRPAATSGDVRALMRPSSEFTISRSAGRRITSRFAASLRSRSAVSALSTVARSDVVTPSICELSASLPARCTSVMSWPWAAGGIESTSFASASRPAASKSIFRPFGQPRARPVSAAEAVSTFAVASRVTSVLTAISSPPRATCSATRSTSASRAGEMSSASRGLSAEACISPEIRAGSTPTAWMAAALVAASASAGSAPVRGSARMSSTIAVASGDAGNSASASSSQSRTSGAASLATPAARITASVAASRGSARTAFIRTPAEGCFSAPCTAATAAGSAATPSIAPRVFSVQIAWMAAGFRRISSREPSSTSFTSAGATSRPPSGRPAARSRSFRCARSRQNMFGSRSAATRSSGEAPASVVRCFASVVASCTTRQSRPCTLSRSGVS